MVDKMIETKVPKDIRKFKGKVIGSFSLRQVICIIIAIIIDILVYLFFLKGTKLDSDSVILILMTCAFIPLTFIAEPSGMPMEVYLKTVIYKNIVYPKQRKSITNLNTYKHIITSEEIKKINKEYKKRIKQEPEWRMYQ